jgi:signal transduction histidine kinase
VDARDRERMRSLLHGALFECQPWEAMERVVRSDGMLRMLHSFGHAAARADGGPARMQAYCVDVTRRERLQQMQSTLYETGLMLARAPEVRQAVSATLRILREKLDWRQALYWRADEAGDCLRALAVHPAADAPPGARLGADQVAALSVRAWREQRATWSLPDGAFALPVSAGGTVLGVIELRGTASCEAETELVEMATSLGALLGDYLVRAGNAERLRGLSRRLLDAQDKERREVATELRDAVARPLAAAHAESGLARLAAPLAAVRELVARLRPASLDDYGLLAALRSYAARFERRTGIEVAVIGADDTIAIDARMESTLFQIALDALDNVARHSGARSAAVEFAIDGGVAVLTVRDDGAGFDVQAPRPRDAWGLALMRERTNVVGGQLRVESAPGGGTRVSVRVRC